MSSKVAAVQIRYPTTAAIIFTHYVSFFKERVQKQLTRRYTHIIYVVQGDYYIYKEFFKHCVRMCAHGGVCVCVTSKTQKEEL